MRDVQHGGKRARILLSAIFLLAGWTWEKLRSEHAGQYEQPLVPAPDGDEWFHVRIVVARPKVSVFVNGAKQPSMVVNELSDRSHGSVGLWVGERSGGNFANLRVTRIR